MSDVARLRARLHAALVSPLAVAALGLGCKATPPPTCPGGDVCAATDVAEQLRKTRETQLNCPMYIGWGADGGPPPLPRLSPFGEGSLNHDATLKRRAAGPATDACCYQWWEPCPGGRPLVEEGRAILPEVRRGEPLRHDTSDGADDHVRAALAAAWLEDARAEHASIASFARAAMELLAVGAPLDLVAATQRASLDEIRHAERCFALASRYAGREIAPGPLPAAAPRPADVARLARDVFEEGCVAETLASLAARRALARCEDEQARAALEEIADDETEHAALAWTTLAWAIAAGGDAARAAVREAAELRRASLAADEASTIERDVEAARHGRLCAAAQDGARRDAWTSIVEPLLAEVLP